MTSLANNQIVSRQRVADHGEVLTSEREVNAMLDMVKHEAERIDSRFLEPACGTGNFLAEVLERKLNVVANRYRRSQLEYERNAVLAVSSLYGIDILQDNAQQCRERLFNVFDQAYTKRFKAKAKEKCRNSVRYILQRNIVWGDALELTRVDDPTQPIVFSEWSLFGGKLTRRDYAFKHLLERRDGKDLPLFSDLGDDVFIPTPIRQFGPTPFLEIANVDAD